MGRTMLAPVVLVVALASVTAGSAGAAARQTRSIPDVSVLFQRALERVRHADHGTFARAVVLEAEGYTRGARCANGSCKGGRPVAGAAGVTAWEFVLQNSTPGSPYLSVVVTYGPSPGGFGRVIGKPAPFLEDVAIRRPPSLTPAGAVSRLRRAGHSSRFVSVTLRDPLGPKRLNPLYIFGFADGSFVSVDTRTGKVRAIH